MKQTRVNGILKIEENYDTYSLVTPTGTYPLDKEYAIRMINEFEMEAKKPLEPATREQIKLLVESYRSYYSITNSPKDFIGWLYEKF